MTTPTLEKLKAVNHNKNETGKVKNMYIVIKPIIPVKAGNDIGQKIKEMYKRLIIR